MYHYFIIIMQHSSDIETINSVLHEQDYIGAIDGMYVRTVLPHHKR